MVKKLKINENTGNIDSVLKSRLYRSVVKEAREQFPWITPTKLIDIEEVTYDDYSTSGRTVSEDRIAGTYIVKTSHDMKLASRYLDDPFVYAYWEVIVLFDGPSIVHCNGDGHGISYPISI